MRRRPILFSSPMVRAIRAGRKTQTRRIIKPQPPSVEDVLKLAGIGYHLAKFVDRETWDVMGPVWAVRQLLGGPEASREARTGQWRCPYGEPGDRLWVREGIRLVERNRPAGRDLAVYIADDAPTPLDTWPWQRSALPGIHMPGGLCRTELEVASVRVERLHDITDADARAEGVVEGVIPADDYGPTRVGYVLGDDDGRCTLYPTERAAFAAGWRKINGPESWDANPWVWAVGFPRFKEDARG